MQQVSLRVHYFQHIIHEGYGSPEHYLKEKGAVLGHTEFFALEKGQQASHLPDIDEVDLLIIMGGVMSVNDEAIYPWLKQEKQWIREFMAKNKPVIGLCLGSQLIASCMGANVHKNKYEEIGWWSIFKVDGAAQHDSSQHIFEFPDDLLALSWHNETFELPEGAVLLAGSAACPNQAYQYKHNVLAFQFHPEITPVNLALFLEEKPDMENKDGTYIQSFHELMDSSLDTFKPANDMLNRAIDFVLEATEQHYRRVTAQPVNNKV
ncbi:type 1 glutamine amidotransferase [Alkanindiges sp. WGS2144]|uniref:type 1 glutamine amidotransferase n=1 Tax=Alkanindiges sp. WGS2144 TaxID=3366808 RepID=UPI003750052F